MRSGPDVSAYCAKCWKLMFKSKEVMVWKYGLESAFKKEPEECQGKLVKLYRTDRFVTARCMACDLPREAERIQGGKKFHSAAPNRPGKVCVENFFCRLAGDTRFEGFLFNRHWRTTLIPDKVTWPKHPSASSGKRVKAIRCWWIPRASERVCRCKILPIFTEKCRNSLLFPILSM